MTRLVLMVTAILGIATTESMAAAPVRREWRVNDITREALVYIPESALQEPAAVIFAFHGHGGTMKFAADRFAYHKHDPKAICVYMQGINTPGKLTDPEGKKTGWQHALGAQDDRDLKFFDAVLATLKKEAKVDDKRIYATGHSNGGGFTYVLWSARGDRFAAVAPVAAVAKPDQIKLFKPKPVFVIAGEKDELVKFEWQKQTVEALRKLNGCEGDPKEWGKVGMLYPSKTDAPVISYYYPGGHQFPTEAPALIVKFFHEHLNK